MDDERRKPVTILVGIITKKGVVLASDSQAEASAGVDYKRLDYTKIYDFTFNGTSVGILGAGEGRFVARATEIIQDLAKGKKFDTARAIADVAEDAMNSITKRYFVDRMKTLMDTGTKLPSLQGEMTANFALLLGVYCGNKPSIFAVSPDGVAAREERYAAMGSGESTAEYLLARLYDDELTIDEAITTAVYVVEEVKKIDAHCGGPTQVLVITADGAVMKSRKDIQKITKFLESQDNSIKDFWRVIVMGPEAMKKIMDETKEKVSRGDSREA
jgi:20S proteasome alpha/beta subunit